MFRKLGELGFMIGLFFAIIAAILAVNAWLGNAGTAINNYTAIAFFVFGIIMMCMKNNDTTKQE